MNNSTIQFLTEDECNYITKQEKSPFLMFFTSEFDENGKKMTAFFDELDRTLYEKIKIYGCDIDKVPMCALKYGIINIPCAVLCKDGRECSRLSGYKTPSQIEEWLRNNEVI